MKSIRIIIAAALGFLVTLGLLLLMHTLIATADRSLDESRAQKIADITMPEIEIKTNVKEQKPEKPEDPEEPPPPLDQPEVQDFEVKHTVNMAATPKQDVKIASGLGLSASDGEYLPIVKVAAIYPRRAQTRGITGYCIVEYTVTTTGATRDVAPIDCQPSGVFEDASVKAALKFKYKPRVIDGEPVEVAGVRNRFLYELED
jgi:protein TonB